MTNIPETGRTPRVQIRLVIIQILVFSLLGTLGGRLWYLQIREGDAYAKEASGNHVQQVVAARRTRLDPGRARCADRRQRDPARRLRLPHRPAEDEGRRRGGPHQARRRPGHEAPRRSWTRSGCATPKTPQPCWNGSPYQPIPITDEATPKQALQIRERSEDFPGITAEPQAVRRYASPGKANTAQVLGYLSPVTDEEIKQGPGHRLARTCAPTRSAAAALSASTTRSCAARPASPATRSTTSAASSARPRPTRPSPARTSSPASTPASSASPSTSSTRR